MTRLDVIKANKNKYAKMEAKIKTMPEGLEKLVSQNLTLKWIKGNNWLGGINDKVASVVFLKLTKMGFTFDEVDEEFNRQMNLCEF